VAEERSGPAGWILEPFEADDGTVPFERFIGKLSDFKFAALDAAMARVLAVRGIDLARTEGLKALGEGLHEFRVRHDAEEIDQMFGGEVGSGAGAPETGAPAGVRALPRRQGDPADRGLRQGWRPERASTAARDSGGSPAPYAVPGTAEVRHVTDRLDHRLHRRISIECPDVVSKLGVDPG
jgi:hypothetical protein